MKFSKKKKEKTLIYRTIAIGRHFADFIFITQIMGFAAMLLWNMKIYTEDWVGFVSVGGQVGAFLAYFGFMLFGIIHLMWKAKSFWTTFHPLNLGIGILILFPINGPWRETISISMISIFLAAVSFRSVLAYPRIALLLSFVMISVVRFKFFYRDLLPISVASFLIAVVIFALIDKNRRIIKISNNVN